jgi:curved DNA-binding protein CbpA
MLALGLTLPCTTDDVLAAYRRKVKLLHPDRGGDRREFLRAGPFRAGDDPPRR